jgi:hypothetical protein
VAKEPHPKHQSYLEVESASNRPAPSRPKYDPEKDRALRDRYRKLVEKGIRDFWANPKRETNRYKRTPWLLIRYAQGDVGLRPIPSGTNFWSSPDIWVQSSDPGGNPVSGEDNYVWTRIFNLGNWNASPVKVDFFWANPALGLGPANWINGLIGTAYVEVKKQFSKEVRCPKPWVPQYLNNGHECLLTQCNNGCLDPIRVPFGPTIDRHVAQRNVNVLKSAAGTALNLDLELNNFLAFATKTQVVVRAYHIAIQDDQGGRTDRLKVLNRVIGFGAWVPTPTEMANILRSESSNRTQAMNAAHWIKSPLDNEAGFRRVNSSFRVVAEVSERRMKLLASEPRRFSAELLLARDAMTKGMCGSAGGAQRISELTMDALESRQVHLQVDLPHSARRGEFLVFHFEQLADEISLGGYTLIVEVTG